MRVPAQRRVKTGGIRSLLFLIAALSFEDEMMPGEASWRALTGIFQIQKQHTLRQYPAAPCRSRIS